MRIIFFLLICFCFINSNLQSQGLNFGMGFEFNQTRFRQRAPTITVPFENPHLPGFGIGTFLFIKYSLSYSFSFQFEPLIGFYNTKSNITEDYQMNIYGLRLESTYKFNKLTCHLGLEYNRLQQIIGTTTRGTKKDWTYFAHSRDLCGPTINLGYNLFKNSNVYLRSTYFLRDFFSSGALDLDGNIVGPVEVTPYVFALGFDFNISKFLNDRKKKN